MSKILERLSWLVTVRPYLTIAVVIIITVVLAAGATLRAPPTEGASVAFLPSGHAIVEATEDIDELFGESGDINIVTILFRGDALTPDGIAQMDGLLNEITSDPSVSALLVPADPRRRPFTFHKFRGTSHWSRIDHPTSNRRCTWHPGDQCRA